VAWGNNPGLGTTLMLSSDGGTTFRSASKASLKDPLLWNTVGVRFNPKTNSFLAVTTPDSVNNGTVREIRVVKVNER
jgi:hypothetical protein